MYEPNATVVAKTEVSATTIILRVAPLGWELPDFVPGQFAVLGLPGSAGRVWFSEPEDEPPAPDRTIKRAYSIASSSKEREYLEFYITLVCSGELTPRLFNLEVGSPLWLSGKFSGVFTLTDVPGDADVALVATGTGLAPYMSMLRTLLECGGPRRYAVIHGARHSWDLGYRSELETMDRCCPNFAYLPVISRPGEEPGGWCGPMGYVQDVWPGAAGAQGTPPLGFVPEPGKTHVFLCGNPGMIETMCGLLERDGFREQKAGHPGTLHVERYW